MKTINVHEAKTRLSSILAEIEEKGESYLICRNGKPIADLVPYKKRSRLKPDPLLSRIKVNCDLTKPFIEEDEWGLNGDST
ncbi:MAG: type II toxin-antitoxin system prevent-host-death family antitoxin [Desulfobacteraceae bacterium]|nr:MAG: type II toxin-antitoxin system prevent-host-death family antitoxin [Desulfobacteraceae bacterium]